LFGVCVIQIKPQLEKLLKLPEDSLTKEIQLSQVNNFVSCLLFHLRSCTYILFSKLSFCFILLLLFCSIISIISIICFVSRSIHTNHAGSAQPVRHVPDPKRSRVIRRSGRKQRKRKSGKSERIRDKNASHDRVNQRKTTGRGEAGSNDESYNVEWL
jgi:hypothetical protein